MRVVLASNNAKKLAELQALFEGLPIELVTQGSLGIAEADEPFQTFLENGLAKARHASAASGLPALADDSGLCVDALGGAPGVASAHFAPLPDAQGSAAASLDREARRRAQDAANNALLLQRLAPHWESAKETMRKSFDFRDFRLKSTSVKETPSSAAGITAPTPARAHGSRCSSPVPAASRCSPRCCCWAGSWAASS